MGKKHADEMLFWTKDEFQTFIEVMKDRPASYAVFMTLYLTGIREGELLVLTPSDIDFEKKTLTANKSYRGRVCQDTFCGFSKLNDLSVKKPPKTSCLHIS